MNIDSQSLDPSTLNEKFDLIFIDGSHSFDSVKGDTVTAFQLLRNDNSIVMWHDYCKTTAEQIRWEVLAGILDGSPPEAHQFIYHVSNTLSSVMIRRQFPTSTLSFPEIPNKSFRVEISASRSVPEVS